MNAQFLPFSAVGVRSPAPEEEDSSDCLHQPSGLPVDDAPSPQTAAVGVTHAAIAPTLRAEGLSLADIEFQRPPQKVQITFPTKFPFKGPY